MKKVVINIIVFIFLTLISTNVQANSEIQASLKCNVDELKNNQEVIITLKYDRYEEINNGINASKATLEYDENVFEEVLEKDFKLLNDWENLKYNKDTKEFIFIKKERSKKAEDIVQITLKVKENANLGKTSIKVKDIVASEGIEDIDILETKIEINVIKENSQKPPSTEQDSNSKDDKVETLPGMGDNKLDDLSPNPIPYAGETYPRSFILLAIVALILNILIVRKKEKMLTKVINKNLKMFMSILIIGIIYTQFIGINYANASSNSTKGELNNDNIVNDLDIDLLELHLIHLQNLPEDKLENADINSDDKITVTDLSLLIQMTRENLKSDVEILNIEADNYYPNKSEEVILSFYANVSNNTSIETVLINNKEYLVQKNDEISGKYEVKIIANNLAGICEYHFTEVLLDNGEKVKVDKKISLDVLKETPKIQDYVSRENMDDLKANVSFNVIDEDSSIKSALFKISNESKELLKEIEIKIGKNEIEIDIEHGKTYEIKLLLYYDLDSNELTEHEKDNTGIVEITKELGISKKKYKETTSMYSWHEQTLVKDASLIYQALQELNVDTLYQSVSSSYMKKEYLEQIIEDYQKQGIKVYRLIGDPSWAYDMTRAKEKIDEINTYNESVNESARFKGVNLDIEPHVDSRWDENPQAAFTQYKNTMIELYEYAKQYDLKVAICTNTWFSSYDGYEELYEKAADTFSIMNYVKASNVKGIREEVEIAEKYNKNIETISHSSSDSDETESYHNDSIDKLLKDQETILQTYSYNNLRASFHHFTTIEYLRDKDVYLQLKSKVVDDSEEPADITLIKEDGKEIKGYPMELGSKTSYIFPGVKEYETYQVNSSSHVANTITIPEAPKGRVTLEVEFKKDTQTDNYTVMKEIDYIESLENIENPERGFYKPVRIDMKTSGNEAISPKNNLVHLRVGIGDFSGEVNGEGDLQFTDDMLNALDETLMNIKQNGGSVIIRFAYDNFDGEENLEPSLDMILTHISQLKMVFDKNKDVIAYIELGFFGPWGEMHSSDICTTENVSKAIDEMLKAAPSEIKIGVRTPEYYAAWAKIDRSELNLNITEKGTDSYRIGLYNDGYLGSESDLGTFENREIEISWLEKQALHTLYGGEVVADYAKGDPLNTIEYISKEGFRTHTTYLNSEWNDKVIDSWKEEIYNGDDELYKGQTGYLYVANHLGYRFVLRKSELTSNIQKDMNLKIKLDIENVGFGNLVNDKIATIVLEKDGKTYEILTNLDATSWNTKEISNINLEVELPEDIEIGEWNIYLRISQNGDLYTDNNYNCIRFANNDIWKQNIGANYIGKVQIVENN